MVKNRYKLSINATHFQSTKALTQPACTFTKPLLMQLPAGKFVEVHFRLWPGT